MKQKTRSLTKKGQKRAAGPGGKDRIKAQGVPDLSQKTQSLTKKGQKQAAGPAVKGRSKARGGPDLSGRGQALPGGKGDAPIAVAAVAPPPSRTPPAKRPPAPPAKPPPVSAAADYRFEVALSFAGDNKRDKVRAVAEILRDELGQGRVFFDEWFEMEIAGVDAQVVLQKFYCKETRLVVVCVCDRYGEKPWTQEEWRAIQAFERGLRDAGSENLRRMRLLLLRFGDGEVDGLFPTAIAIDVRDFDPRAIADLILERLRLARGEREAIPPRVDRRVRGDRVGRQARGEREAIPPSPRESGSAPSNVPVRVDEHLDRAQRMVEAMLSRYPLLRGRLADRLKCAPAELVRVLFAMRGLQLADLGAALYLELKPRSDASADLKALESVIFTVLPHASDLRNQGARFPESSERGCDVVELTYRSRAIAEAVVAGWVGRACLFVKNSGKEPYGQGAIIKPPATAHAALFPTEEHFRRDLVADLARQFKIERSNPRDLATAVNDWLHVAAVNDRRANEAVARENAGADLMRPERYYYLFRDAEYAEEGERDRWWDLVKAALHTSGGLPRLVLVRMTGGEQSEENHFDGHLSAIVNEGKPS